MPRVEIQVETRLHRVCVYHTRMSQRQLCQLTRPQEQYCCCAKHREYLVVYSTSTRKYEIIRCGTWCFQAWPMLAAATAPLCTAGKISCNPDVCCTTAVPPLTPPLFWFFLVNRGTAEKHMPGTGTLLATTTATNGILVFFALTFSTYLCPQSSTTSVRADAS